ncbi:MAG: peptidoglycan-associated lipoprotein Pal, partial [Limisphaerales bacterium]
SALAAETIHFQFDSAVIRDSETQKLQQVAAALQANASANVMIEGNCDERGTEEYNRSLGERRAEAAREALVGMGIDANRIHTISYGKDKPVDPGHDVAAWAQNRRDDFVLLTPKAGA